MYGAPGMCGYTAQRIKSIPPLIDAIKDIQIQRPHSRLLLKVRNEEFRMNLLANGCLEFNESVQPIAIEKAIENVIKNFGASLEDLGVL